MPADPSQWSPLHDLGLIYLTLTHGTDADLVPAEKQAMKEKLMKWQPETPRRPADVEKVMDEVMLTYMSETSDQMIQAAVISIEQTMPRQMRIAVLNDLADIASADGTIVPPEISFIQQLAREWNVEEDLE